MCAGEGRDVLPILAAHDQGDRVRALLVEIDPRLAGRAREAAGERGLSRVEVRTADARITDAYLDFAPAHLVLACGVFGNITSADARGTIAALPSLLAPGGVVIWTRGRPDDGTEPSQRVRIWFAADGFTELAFAAPDDATFRVGMHQLAAGAGQRRSAQLATVQLCLARKPHQVHRPGACIHLYRAIAFAAVALQARRGPLSRFRVENCSSLRYAPH
jgi:hypothetical protein